MRHLPRLVTGSLAACAAAAALFLAVGSAGASAHPAAGPQRARAEALARAAIERLTARWQRDGQRSAQRLADRPRAALSPVTSSDWGGYADISEIYSKVTGEWAQPAITCTSTTAEVVTWVGIDGYSSDTVEQAGSLAECYQDTAYYYTWWEVYPTNGLQVVGGSVAAGDAMTGSVSRSGASYTFKVTDTTHPANSFSATAACTGCAGSSAEWIAGSSAGTSTVIPAVTWTLSGATVTAGSVTGVISTFPYEKIVPVNGTTSALNAAGNSFTVTWRRTTP